MPSVQTPSVLVFDVNETLLDLTTLEPVFERLFGDSRAMREWFGQLILYSEALTLANLYSPFGELAAGALRMMGDVTDVAVKDADVDELKERMLSMPALPDVAPALVTLRKAGFRLVTLTNSQPGPSPTPLERAGLAEHFESSFSIDRVRRFKPAPETYRMVADDLGVGLPDLCLVACHLWDTLGAQAAGCAGALVKRPGNSELPAPGVPMPDIIAKDMQELATVAVSKWAAGSDAR